MGEFTTCQPVTRDCFSSIINSSGKPPVNQGLFRYNKEILEKIHHYRLLNKIKYQKVNIHYHITEDTIYMTPATFPWCNMVLTVFTYSSPLLRITNYFKLQNQV